MGATRISYFCKMKIREALFCFCNMLLICCCSRHKTCYGVRLVNRFQFCALRSKPLSGDLIKLTNEILTITHFRSKLLPVLLFVCPAQLGHHRISECSMARSLASRVVPLTFSLALVAILTFCSPTTRQGSLQASSPNTSSPQTAHVQLVKI